MKVLYFFTSFFSYVLFAQVGINTLDPKSDLHINGSLQLSNQLNVGGDNLTAGNPGTNFKVLTSQGEGSTPIWKSIKEVTVVPLIIATGSANYTNYVQAIKESIPLSSVNITEPEYIRYDDSTRNFIINKKGVYRIIGQLNSGDVDCPGVGLVVAYLIKNNSSIIAAKSTSPGSCTPSTKHGINGIDLFDVGDKISLDFYRSLIRNTDLTIPLVSGSITVMFVGTLEDIEEEQD